MRRLVHLVIVLVVLTGLHFWGPAGVEARVGPYVQVAAEKTGVLALVRGWRGTVRPAIGRAASDAWGQLERAAARAIEGVERAADEAGQWVTGGRGSAAPADAQDAGGSPTK